MLGRRFDDGQPPHHVAPAKDLGEVRSCPACLSRRLWLVEAVESEEIGRRWSQEVAAAGPMIAQYVKSGRMPAEIKVYGCHDCALQYADPTFAAGPEWYERVEYYTDRWEFGRCLDQIGQRPQRLVEFGCGEGFFLERAARAGHSPLGVDFNEAALRVAAEKGLEAHPWALADIGAWWPEDVGAVVLFQVIEHLEDLDVFFGQLARVAPRGSTLHVSCPSPRRYVTRYHPDERVGAREMWDYPPHHQTRWSRSALHALFARFGWTLEIYEEEPVYWRRLSRALVVRDLRRLGTELSDLSVLHRRLLVLEKLWQTRGVADRCSNWSLYCEARRD